MCVRLSPSHPAARIVVGLYIFLATFLVGFFVVQAASFFTLTTKERVELDAVVDGPKQVSACNNEDGISLLRWHDVPTQARLPDPIIGIGNQGSKSIYFSDGALEVNDSVHFASAVLVLPKSSGTETELKPFDLGDFRLPEFTEHRSFTFTFSYRVDESQTQHFMTAHFNEYGQVPDGCSFPVFRPRP